MTQESNDTNRQVHPVQSADLEPPAGDASREDRKGPRKRVRRAVEKSMQAWLAANGAAAPGPDQSESDAAAPAATTPTVDDQPVPRTRPSMIKQVRFKVSFFRVFWRGVRWGLALLRFFSGNLWDWVRKRGSPKRRAKRLRVTLEGMGGAFVKLGQQMSVRADLLPFEYCNELAQMLDNVPKFPTEEAKEVVERALRRKCGVGIDEVFVMFADEPIGSASLACVYRAMLRNGDEVAVKVRRPGIGEDIEADLRVLDWALWLAELFVLRPGWSENLRAELRSMLTEELDFNKEARFQDIFRRRARKDKVRFATAPRIYSELIDQDVLVSEFIHGMTLREVLDIIENNDREGIARLKELDIDPRVIARRLLHVNNWSLFENLIFHADPHPANILVQPNSKLVFVDFGSCGTIDEEMRRKSREMFRHQARRDPGGMAQGALALLEPLPAIDVQKFEKELEASLAEALHATKSAHSEWWERTTVGIWIRIFDSARKHQIPMNLNVLRMNRGSLLYDTLAARLDGSIDVFKIYRQYAKHAGKRARKRLEKKVTRFVEHGPSRRDHLTINEIVDLSHRLKYATERVLDTPLLKYSLTVKKEAYMFSILIRLLVCGAVIAAACLLLPAVFAAREGLRLFLAHELPSDLTMVWETAKASMAEWRSVFYYYYAAVFVCLVVPAVLVMWTNIRKAWFRLLDFDREL